MPDPLPIDRRTHRTQRLIMRPWRADDRAPFAEMNADPRVMEYFPALMTQAESDAAVDRMDGLIAAQGWGLWALEVAEGDDAAGRFAGFTGMSSPTFEAHFTPCVEIGWRLPRWAWGRGYASEAARAPLAIGFDDLQREEIVSFTTIRNDRSRKVMERLGLTHDPADDSPTRWSRPPAPPARTSCTGSPASDIASCTQREHRPG